MKVAALILFGASLCPAGIIIGLGHAPGSVSNINLGSELTSTTIDGTVDGFTVLFTGQNGIGIGGGGQANILETSSPVNGGILFQIPGEMFTTFEVNPQREGKAKKGSQLLITAIGTLTTVTDFALPLGSGENRLYVQATGESLLSVLVEVQGDTYDRYKQPRVDVLDASAVPEPSSMALLGAGLPVLMWLRKRSHTK